MLKLPLLIVILVVLIANPLGQGQAEQISQEQSRRQLDINGGFENAAVMPGTSHVFLQAGDTEINGWIVGGNGIDYIGGIWQPSEGSRSIDLSGSSNGTISTTLKTVPGATYQLLFDMAGNPAGEPYEKVLRVWTDDKYQDFVFNTKGRTLENIGWQTMSLEFTATSSATLLKFESLTTTSYGPALDNVRVMPLYEGRNSEAPDAGEGFAGIQIGTGYSCYAEPWPTNNQEERIFGQDACSGVYNNPPNPTSFTISETRTITKIGTYHWNGAKGVTPGTIELRDQNGNIWGPWQAIGLNGQGGVPNAYWVVYLTSLELPAGTYTITDSDQSTWSYNSESGNSGIVSIVALATTSGTSGDISGKVEWPISAGGNGHYYEAVLVPGGITWNDAKSAAEAKGGLLASITSEAENQFVYNLVAGDDRYWTLEPTKNGEGPWLGGYQPPGSTEPDGGWAWVTGEPFSYTNWHTGEPNNGGGLGYVEDNLIFFGPGTLKSPAWNDCRHDFSAKGYIVEYEV